MGAANGTSRVRGTRSVTCPFFSSLSEDFGYPNASIRAIEEAVTRRKTSVMINSLEDDCVYPAHKP
jgi:hypothetical protein